MSRVWMNISGYGSILIAASLLGGCSGPATIDDGERNRDPSLVIDRTWHWVSTTTREQTVNVTDPARYHLRLEGSGQAQFSFDCNRGRGNYQIADGRLSFGPVATTRMFCPDDSQDALFESGLQQVQGFHLRGDELFLEMPDSDGFMRFRTSP